jgi:hypothetical protein
MKGKAFMINLYQNRLLSLIESYTNTIDKIYYTAIKEAIQIALTIGK